VTLAAANVEHEYDYIFSCNSVTLPEIILAPLLFSSLRIPAGD
jgi:hypothetical protein